MEPDTSILTSPVRSLTFQSTGSSRGLTSICPIRLVTGRISIHALRTESDLCQSYRLVAYPNFNPRSPHGERPMSIISPCCIPEFQSTLSARRATANTANRLPVSAPLLQHILQDFASIRHIQTEERRNCSCKAKFRKAARSSRSARNTGIASLAVSFRVLKKGVNLGPIFR